MKRRDPVALDFEVDKLTNSVENVITGDSFPTDILRISTQDLKSINRKNGWVFKWNAEFEHPEREVYKLTIVNNQSVIQGLISLQVMPDHVFMHLVESAPFNKGKNKVYVGVPGNLVAFACQLSFQRGYEGNIAFISKTQLIEHYSKSLGAIHIGNQRMIIIPSVALNLIEKYF